MSNDFEIDLLENPLPEDSKIHLPQNFVSVGTVEVDDIKVYIHQDVYRQIEKFSKSNTEKELGSILIGETFTDLGVTHVIISNFIEAKFTDASASTLTFTHETWADIHEQKNNLYSGKKIIGWQHTHPNYGIFLSNYDLFIQQNFFNLPFQVAYVVDPIANTRGFFQWKNDKTEKLNGFYVYDEVGKAITVTTAKKASSPKNTSSKAPSMLSFFITLFLLIGLITVSFFCFLLNKKFENLIESQQTLKEEIHNQSQDKTSSIFPEKSDSSGLQFISYRVQEGDTLFAICKNHQIDFEANLSLIQAINGITDMNMIKAGQILLLPIIGKN